MLDNLHPLNSELELQMDLEQQTLHFLMSLVNQTLMECSSTEFVCTLSSMIRVLVCMFMVTIALEEAPQVLVDVLSQLCSQLKVEDHSLSQLKLLFLLDKNGVLTTILLNM